MIKKLVRMYDTTLKCVHSATTYFNGRYVKLSLPVYRILIAVNATEVPTNLKQYYADRLMLELIQEGRL